MIRVNSIEIHGFKSSTRIARAEFSHESVSVIYGPNGCGKTTFLKILHGVLSQDDAPLIQNSVSKVTLVAEETGVPKELAVWRDENGDYVWDEILDSIISDTSSLSLGVDRGITNQSFKADPGFIMDFFRSPRRRSYLSRDISLGQFSEELSLYFRQSQRISRNRLNSINYDKRHLYLQNIKIDNVEELLIERYRIARMMASRKIQSALFDTLSIAISLDERPQEKQVLPDDFEIRLRDNNARIREALDDGSENQFKDTVIEILDSVAVGDGVEKIANHPILSQLFLNIIEELEMEKLILSSINLLVETFNNYLIEDKKLVVTSREAFVEVNGDTHTVNELSSGERHILTFLSLVLFEGESRNFLLIDEPEISLNITWQRELMGLFRSLVPNTQIIVASHSPALVKDNQGYLTQLVVGNK
ncbi:MULTISPECIES: AAA family ATPase [unclassified Pseudoalteromonas]|uniref:AAA family ATPase n=1 Tax=unclassified Pseudoalteromonas TaxID=194690 RepID=UPI0015D4E73D|nr:MULTISPECIES: AAA family ATPase [unclassified Pseudoalteromonas]MDP2635106.1 AAA family ATPase [Pseudoalteromonas sp. 1_MG-2023]